MTKSKTCPRKNTHYENVLQQVGQNPTIMTFQNPNSKTLPRKKSQVLLLGLLGSWTYDLDLTIAIDLVSTMIINIIIINAPIAIAIDITITLTVAVYAPPKKASTAPARGLIMRMSFNK